MGGKIFLHLMHTGRISHHSNMAAGSHILAASPIRAAGEMWTDAEQMQPYPVPEEMTSEDLSNTRTEFVNDAKNAIILCGGYNPASAHTNIERGQADMIAFGRPFICNPDLVRRLKNNWDISGNLKTELFYSSDEKGYTDYPLF